MNETVDSVRRVADITAEIQATSQEQTQGIEQINQPMTLKGPSGQTASKRRAVIPHQPSLLDSVESGYSLFSF